MCSRESCELTWNLGMRPSKSVFHFVQGSDPLPSQKSFRALCWIKLCKRLAFSLGAHVVIPPQHGHQRGPGETHRLLVIQTHSRHLRHFPNPHTRGRLHSKRLPQQRGRILVLHILDTHRLTQVPVPAAAKKEFLSLYEDLTGKGVSVTGKRTSVCPVWFGRSRPGRGVLPGSDIINLSNSSSGEKSKSNPLLSRCCC